MKERPADFRGLLSSSSSSSLYSSYWRLVGGVLVAVNNIVEDDDIFDGVRIMILFLFARDWWHRRRSMMLLCEEVLLVSITLFALNEVVVEMTTARKNSTDMSCGWGDDIFVLQGQCQRAMLTRGRNPPQYLLALLREAHWYGRLRATLYQGSKSSLVDGKLLCRFFVQHGWNGRLHTEELVVGGRESNLQLGAFQLNSSNHNLPFGSEGKSNLSKKLAWCSVWASDEERRPNRTLRSTHYLCDWLHWIKLNLYSH